MRDLYNRKKKLDYWIKRIHNKENIISSNFIQNAYAAKVDGAEDNDQKKDFNNKEDNSIFNSAAVGDFDCNDDAEVTVDNY